MLFSSITFLYFFLPLTLVCYRIVPRRAKNLCLCAVSSVFYAWGEPTGLFLMLGQIITAYILTGISEKRKGTRMGRIVYILSVFVPFVFLFYYKYSYFFLRGIIPGLSKASLPIGISFYTFQLVSYCIDVHRGDAKRQKKLIDLIAYVTLFPQLIAGPIVRYTQIEQELSDRHITARDMAEGCIRFTIGLSKKVLLANVLGEFVQETASLVHTSVVLAWICAAAAAMQIYYDFSGYSDMAIGLGRMFGFHFPENFRYPFISGSATEFWRRWHITLGVWFRDYVYIPLGGNRVGMLRWIGNIMLVWLLTGLWHGAGWNYILWGVFFGILLLLEKAIRIWRERSGIDRMEKRSRFQYGLTIAVRHMYMLVVIMVSFRIFGIEDRKELAQTLQAMFGWTRQAAQQSTRQVAYMLRNRAVLLMVGMIGSTPVPAYLWKRYHKLLGNHWLYYMSQGAGILLLIILCTAYLIDGSFNPFLYFRF